MLKILRKNYKKDAGESQVTDDDSDEEIFAKKGKWKPLPYKPTYAEYHPCYHRWQEKHPSTPSLVNVRYNQLPFTERNDFLAKPLCRRLLVVWIRFADIMIPRKREVLLTRLLECGFTEEELEEFLKEERKRKEYLRKLADAGPFDVFDENGNLISSKATKGAKKSLKKKTKKKGKKKGKSKTKKKGKKKGKNKKGKKGKKGLKSKKSAKSLKGSSGFKPGKPGQLKPGWPHQTGMRLMSLMLSLAEEAVDESFLSRATAYFNVQADLLMQVISEAMLLLPLNQSNPSQLEIKFASFCLNLSVWVAQNVTAVAQAIPDDEVSTRLSLHGDDIVRKQGGKKKGKKKKDKTKTDVKKKGKKGKKKTGNKTETTMNVDLPDFETPHHSLKDKIDRKWTEKEFPSVKPVKFGRPSEMEASLRISGDFVPFTSSTPSGSTRLSEVNQFSFLQSSKWYNPRAPEFMYDGPHVPPQGVQFSTIDTLLKWHLSDVEMEPQNMIPNQVPQFYPQQRPLIFDRDSGSPPDDPGPWFIMSNLQYYSKEVTFWPSAVAVEEVQLIVDLVLSMMIIPKLTVSRMLELVAEICEAMNVSEVEEELTPEEQIIQDKILIVLEQIFVKCFGSHFRDQNKDTIIYMRVMCKRGAAFIRHLYDLTALTLWKIQRMLPPPPTPEPVVEEPEYDLDAISDWDEWLVFLLNALKIAREWQKWLRDSTQTAVFPDDRSILISKAENYLSVGRDLRKIAAAFEEKTEFLKIIPLRPQRPFAINPSELDESDNELWLTDE